MRRGVDLAAWRAERIEAAAVPLTVDDGDPILVLPVDLWPDDIGRVPDEEALAGIFDGEGADAARRYTAAGGNYATLVKIVTGSDDVGESAGS